MQPARRPLLPLREIASLALPQAHFSFTDARGVETQIELRCVGNKLADASHDEPYYCEVVKRVGGVELSAHAIYPRQLESLLARLWLEQSEASGTYPAAAAPGVLKAQWSFSKELTLEQTSEQPSRAATWLFATLSNWSNFSR